MRFFAAVLAVVLPVTASAAEALEAGTVAVAPTAIDSLSTSGDGRIVIVAQESGVRFLEGSKFMLDRAEGETLFVLDAQLGTCEKQREDCQKMLLGKSPTPGFLSTPTGKAYVVAGFTIGLSAAFAAGVLVAKQ